MNILKQFLTRFILKPLPASRKTLPGVATICLLFLVLSVSLTACSDATATATDQYPKVGSPSFLLMSENNGITWAKNLSPNSSIAGLNTVNCPSSQVCYAWDSQGIPYQTLNGGINWKSYSYVGGYYSFEGKLSCYDNNNCYLLLNGSVTRIINGSSSQEENFDTQGLQLPRSISCPTLDRCLLVGTNSLIRVTIDSGKTWTALQLPIQDNFQEVRCPDVNVCIIGAESGKLIRTEDGGKTWQNISQPSIVGIDSITCPSIEVCYLVGFANPASHGKTVFVTTDSGKTWQQGPVHFNRTGARARISCPTNTTCYVTGDKGEVLYTNTSGKLWYSRKTGYDREIKDISCPTASKCFIVLA